MKKWREYTYIISYLQVTRDAKELDFNIISRKPLDSTNSDNSIFNSEEDQFMGIEGKWKTHFSKFALYEDLQYLQSNENSIQILDCFGQIFVKSLICSLEVSYFDILRASGWVG